MTESFNLSMDFVNDANRKEHMEKFEELCVQLKTEHQIAEENLSKCSLEAAVEGDVHLVGDADPDTVDANNGNDISSEVTLRQAKMNRELQAINKLLTKKEELASRLVMSDEKITTMKQSYEACRLFINEEQPFDDRYFH